MVAPHTVAGRFGVGKKQIKLADAATVLQITGYPVGGVPPFGYPEPVPALLDRAIRKWDVVYAGGGDDRTLLCIGVDELARVVEGEWLPLTAGSEPDPIS